jgi:hypothetical protein
MDRKQTMYLDRNQVAGDMKQYWTFVNMAVNLRLYKILEVP